MSQQTTTPEDHIVSTDLEGGEGILVDLNSKRYYTLNETGMLIWKALEDGKDREAIIAELTAGYEVDAEHAAASVDRLLEEFLSRNLAR